MTTLSRVVRNLKANVAAALPEATIHRLATDLDLRFRQRSLTPVVTTYLFLRQILHGNPAVGELRHLADFDFTDSAYCQARQRLPVGFFYRLHRAVLGPCCSDAERDQDALWHGHRLFALDGSSFSMPDTPELQQEFGQPGGQAQGCGFPTAHLLVQFDLHTGYLLRALAAPCRTHDMAKAAVMHQDLREGDVVLGDRAFCSYAHLALCQRRHLHGIFRAHQRLLISFQPHRRHAQPGKGKPADAGLPRSRWLKRLGKHDQLVEYFRPKQRPKWMSGAEYAALPASIIVREVRFEVGIPGRRTHAVTLVTTLLDGQRYSARALARLYEKRWQVEVNLRHLKQTLGMDVLRCETFAGVMKELLMFVVAYNLVRRVMVAAGQRQGVEPNRISFIDALRWLRHAKPGAELPRLKVNPDRPGRVEPRVRKRRPKQYRLMKRPRAILRQAALEEPAEEKKVAA